MHQTRLTFGSKIFTIFENRREHRGLSLGFSPVAKVEAETLRPIPDATDWKGATYATEPG
jgi:hypothetical protein